MDKLKQWVALTVVAAVAIVAGGWFLLIAPKHSDASDLRTRADAARADDTRLSGQIAMLKAQNKEAPAQQAKLAAVAAKIPDNPALPSLIRALTKAADDTGVELVSLSPMAPAPVATAAATKPVTAAGAASAAAPAAGTAKHVAAAASAGTLESIGLTLNVVGGYFQVEQFLDRVENLTRAAKVVSLTLAPGTNPVAPAGAPAVAGGAPAAPVAATDPGKVLSATITGTVYMAIGRPTFTVGGNDHDDHGTETVEAPAAGGGDRKRVIVAGGVAAALLLGFGGYKLMSGGGSEDAALNTPIVHHQVKPKAAPVKAAPAKKHPAAAQLVPPVTTVPLGRDPFLALYTEPAPVAPAAVAPPATGTTTPGSTGAVTTPPVATTYPLRLVRVYGTGKDLTGVFTVNGKTQTAKAGSVFGKSSELKLLSLQQQVKGVWTAVVQVGDADPFDATAGKVYYVL